MKHTEHIANFCSDQGVLDILEEIGEYLDSIDLKNLKLREGRQNRIEWKTAVSDNYLSTFRKTVRPGPPWHQKIVDLLLDLNQRNRNTKMADLATAIGIKGHKIKIHAPLLMLSKDSIIKKGLELGIDYSKTISCYNPSTLGASCGTCDSCIIRKKAFKELKLTDPVAYE